MSKKTCSASILIKGASVCCLLFASSLAAQCAAWDAASSQLVPGIDVAPQHVAWWDPDGVGPVPGRVVVRGGNEVWSLDPVTEVWEPLPALNHHVGQLVANPAGSLYCVDQLPSGNWGIVVFDGQAWQAIDGGANGKIEVLKVHPSGDLLVAGQFTTIGGVSAPHVAQRQGSQWTALGSGSPSSSYLQFLQNGAIHDVEVDAGGRPVVAGQNMRICSVSQFGAVSCQSTNVARYENGQWVELGGSPARAWDLISGPGGTLVAAFGWPASYFASWEGPGLGWVQLGQIFSSLQAPSMVFDSQGTLLAGGRFVTVAGPTHHMLEWDGANWQPLPADVGDAVNDLLLVPGSSDIMAVGNFDQAGEHRVADIASWNGALWSPVGRGINDSVRAIIAGAEPGSFFVGGDFTWASGGARHVAYWNGSETEALGAGVDGPVHALLRMANGDVIAAGGFAMAGALPAAGIARWDGTDWAALAEGLDGTVFALAEMPNGDLIVGGDFDVAGGVMAHGLARWDGSAWSAFDSSVDGVTHDLIPTSSGGLYVAGRFDAMGGSTATRNVGYWDGSSWMLLPLAMATVRSIACLPGGDIIAGGSSGMRRWNGASWSQSFVTGGTDDVNDIVVLPNGDLVVAGEFGEGGVYNIARWDGSSFDEVGLQPTYPFTEVFAVALDGRGNLAAGSRPAVNTSPYFHALGFYRTTCPAAVLATSSSCMSSGGGNDLEADGQPWVGTDFEVRGTGFPTQSLVLMLTGFSAIQIPLSAVFGNSPPGCDGLVTPDLVQTITQQAGSFTSVLQLPDDPVFIGGMLFQQALALDFGNPTVGLEITSSGSLDLTVGDF